MKKNICLLAAAFVLIPGLYTSAPAAQPDDEPQLIQTLQSSASPAEKDAACARLKFIGTARSVSALAALLTDDQLSHSARYALESMRFEAAGEALVGALGKTSGMLQVGILNSLAVRHELWAAPVIATLLGNTDPSVAAAAAHALGEIGGPAVLKALQAAAKRSSGRVHSAIVDAQLRCASQLLTAGKDANARAIYKPLFDTEPADRVRVAAYRGLILASGKDGLALTVRGIEGPPGPAQVAAMQLVSVLQTPGAAQTLAGLLPRLPAPRQVALIDGLAQRGDPIAATPIAALSSGAAPETRLAIIKALDTLGSASNVPLLSDLAATGSAAEQKEAREALADLWRGNVTDTLLGQLETSGPAVQSELVRALGARSDKVAIPKLFELAQRGPEATRAAALKALGLLVDDSQVGSLVRFVLDTKDPAARNEAVEALNVACQHIRSRRGQVDAKPLAEGLATASPDVRMALLPIFSGLPEPEARAALRLALQDSDARVREAAIRALCDTVDPDLLDDLVGLVQARPEDNFRALAIAAAVRLTNEEKTKLTEAHRIGALRQLFGAAGRTEEKRLVLAGLAEVPHPDALRVVESALGDADVQTEASLAALKIAATLPSTQAQLCESVLQKALAGSTNAATRQALTAAIQQIQANADYISDWQIAGPFTQSGKDYAALFDIVFPPETLEPKGVQWKGLPPVGDPKRPWEMDLLKAFGGGTQCVAYARTWVQSDQDQDAQLELGSDDGIKVWLNEKQVYALNVARALQQGSDRTGVHLHSGWNQLLLKITQHNQGWAFCARFRKPDGSPLEGVRCQAAPDTHASAPASQ